MASYLGVSHATDQLNESCLALNFNNLQKLNDTQIATDVAIGIIS